jgi:hypothetical protein
LGGTRRFECETLPGNWVEFQAAWSRRELREALNELDEGFAALLQRKIAGCCLETGSGAPLDAPALITREALDQDMRYEVYCWLTTTLIQFVMEVQRLGEAMRRQLWRDLAKGETAAAQTETPTAQTAQTESEAPAPDGALSLSPMP